MANFILSKISCLVPQAQNRVGSPLQIFDVYRKHSKLVEAADKNVSKNIRDKTKRELEMLWKADFPPLKDHLIQLESTLSKLENREPRDFDLPAMEPFIPNIMRR